VYEVLAFHAFKASGSEYDLICINEGDVRYFMPEPCLLEDLSTSSINLIVEFHSDIASHTDPEQSMKVGRPAHGSLATEKANQYLMEEHISSHAHSPKALPAHLEATRTTGTSQGGGLNSDSKMHLNNFIQRNGFALPSYQDSQVGSSHARYWTSTVKVNGQTYEGRGLSKMMAQNAAAKQALDDLAAKSSW